MTAAQSCQNLSGSRLSYSTILSRNGSSNLSNKSNNSQNSSIGHVSIKRRPKAAVRNLLWNQLPIKVKKARKDKTHTISFDTRLKYQDSVSTVYGESEEFETKKAWP